MDYEELEKKVEELEAEKEIANLKLEELEEGNKTLQESLDTAETKLEGEGKKDKNFANLRKTKEQIEEEKKDMATKVEELTKEIGDMKQADLDKVKDKVMKQYAGDDEELQKKIESQLDIISADLPMEERLAKAVELSGIKPGHENNSFYGGVGIDGSGDVPVKKGNYLETEQGKAMAESLEIDLTNGDDKKE